MTSYLRSIWTMLAVGLATQGAGLPAWADDLKVVTTIKPVHSITAAVMEGVGTPTLLVAGSASPHTFSLTPTGMRASLAADVFIRVSPIIEPFSDKIVATLPPSATVLTLADASGLTLYPRRSGATFEAHDHGGDHHGDDGDADGHIWLDPHNAEAMARAIASTLAARDPTHADRYQANADRLTARINGLSVALGDRLATVAKRPFVVFHDATQYFELAFGLNAIGSVTVSPDAQPSAYRIGALREKISALKAVCVFGEPQFNAQLVAAVTEGTGAKTGTLDPEGAALNPGPELYFELMHGLASALSTCLAP